MNTIKNLILLLLIIHFFAACKETIIPPTTLCNDDSGLSFNDSHPKAAAIQATIDQYVANGLPGMTILISDDDGLWMQSGGFADIERNIKMEPCHINKLGSITKMMVGALVWTLVQEETLAIDDPINKYIPDVANKIENGNDITLDMLISHSSGVYDIATDLGFNLAVLNDLSRSWSSEEILEHLEGKPANFLPGTDVEYSNSNTMLVGMVIEAATGKRHGDLLKERICDPLGMNNTVYYDYSVDFPFDYLAQGYIDFNNDGGDIQNISHLNPGNGNGFTGVYSTVTDLYLFMNALLRDQTIITPDNLDLIFESMNSREGSTWRSSIGAIHDEYQDLFDGGVHAYGHTGGDIGYSSNLNYLPHNNTIFSATYNYGTNLSSDLGLQLKRLREDLFEIMAR